LKKIQTYFNFSEMPKLEQDDAFWQKLDDEVDKSYKGRPGWIVHSAVLDGLSYGLNKAFTEGWHKSPACRDAFGEAWTTKKIVVKLDGAVKPMHLVQLEDGVLVIHTSPAKICSNCQNIGSDPSVMTTCDLKIDGISWKYRFNLDNGAMGKINTHLANMKTALGKEISIDVQWDVFGTALKEIDGKPDWDIRAGDFFQYCLDGLGPVIVKKAKDDMIKEALLEKWTTGIIQVTVDKDLSKKYEKRNYNAVDFINGKLMIFIAKTGNPGQVGEDIEHRL